MATFREHLSAWWNNEPLAKEVLTDAVFASSSEPKVPSRLKAPTSINRPQIIKELFLKHSLILEELVTLRHDNTIAEQLNLVRPDCVAFRSLTRSDFIACVDAKDLEAIFLDVKRKWLFEMLLRCDLFDPSDENIAARIEQVFPGETQTRVNLQAAIVYNCSYAYEAGLGFVSVDEISEVLNAY